MILSGPEIARQVALGRILIDPFDPSRVGSNSYNLRLHDRLLAYTEETLDMRVRPQTEELVIPPEGLVLQPGRLYLGRTAERTATDYYVPMLEGRSSIGRLGITVHVTAGFGDVGFDGCWTLEIQCIHPVRIYAGVEICQICYHEIAGEIKLYHSEKYQHQEIRPSLLYMDFERQNAQNPGADSEK